MSEYGWLVENGKSGNELRYRTMRQGMAVWTADHNEALRFARREDAERFAAEDDDAWRIAEHAWDDLPELTKAPPDDPGPVVLASDIMELVRRKHAADHLHESTESSAAPSPPKDPRDEALKVAREALETVAARTQDKLPPYRAIDIGIAVRITMELSGVSEAQRSECPLERIVIPHGGYRTIVADPPWKYGKWGKASIAPRGSSYAPQESNMPYQTMTVAEIAALPVAEIAAADCELYLWTTQKYLPDAFGVIDAWGFRYCQTLTWCKRPKGTGQGGLYCPTTEFLLLGRKGRMPKKQRIETTWWEVKRPMRHSQKPEHFQDVIEMQGDGPRIELFARRRRPGWDVWGNEV